MPSNDKKYPSIYSIGKLVGVNQYLAEYMVQRQSRLKQVDLPQQFWKSDKVWEKEYLRQLRAANGLLRIYSAEAISAALRSKQGKRIYSLSAKFLDDLIREESRKIDLLKTIQSNDIKEEVEEIQQEKVENIRPEFKTKKSLRDKLDL